MNILFHCFFGVISQTKLNLQCDGHPRILVAYKLDLVNSRKELRRESLAAMNQIVIHVKRIEPRSA